MNRISLEKLPRPFRQVLEERLAGSVELLLYEPPSDLTRGSGASVLAVGLEGWVVLTQTLDGVVSIHHADYGDTLSLELATIRLCGELCIGYVANGNLRAASLKFDVAHLGAYRDSACQILNFIDEVTERSNLPVEAKRESDTWPQVTHGVAYCYLPAGRCLLSVMQWPPGFGDSYRSCFEDLAPEAMLLLTDRELILVSEERGRSWLRVGKPLPRYGGIVTYLPLARLGECRLDGGSDESSIILEINLHPTRRNKSFQRMVADTVRASLPRRMFHNTAAFLNEVSNQRLCSGLTALGWDELWEPSTRVTKQNAV